MHSQWAESKRCAGPSKINLSLSVYFFDVCSLPIHFPLHVLTMCWRYLSLNHCVHLRFVLCLLWLQVNNLTYCVCSLKLGPYLSDPDLHVSALHYYIIYFDEALWFVQHDYWAFFLTLTDNFRNPNIHFACSYKIKQEYPFHCIWRNSEALYASRIGAICTTMEKMVKPLHTWKTTQVCEAYQY